MWFTSSSLLLSGVSESVEQRIIDLLLLLRVEGTIITLLVLFFLLDGGVSTEDGPLPVGLSGHIVPVKLGIDGIAIGTGTGTCVGTLLGTLFGSRIGVFRLVGTALTLGGGGDDLGGSVVVDNVPIGGGFGRSVAVGFSLYGSSAGCLLTTPFLRRFSRGCRFSVGVTCFGVNRLGLDGLAALLRSNFGRSSLVVILVLGNISLSLGFLVNGSGGSIADACATQELLFDGKEAGVG